MMSLIIVVFDNVCKSTYETRQLGVLAINMNMIIESTVSYIISVSRCV